MLIDQLLQQARDFINSPEAAPAPSVPKDWAQGRTVFGGLSASMLYAAMQEKVAGGRVLRSLTTNFVGPLVVEAPFTIEVEILREGKSATQAVAKAIQEGKICVIQQACFGVERESKIVVENNDLHGMQPPKKAKFIPQIPKVTPKFLRHVDLAIDDGKMPFSGSKHSHMHGWMRFTEAPESIGDAHLICLVDAWPPTILQMPRWPAPASTMSWNLEFIHPHQPVSPTDWFAYQAHTRQAAGGYAHTEANIWDDAGELVAISRQTVAIFD